MVIHPTATIECDEFIAGPGLVVRAHAEIYGRRVVLGRECFIDEYAVIGGGSASAGELIAGDWLHMGMFSQVNTARHVHIGHEVGIGIGSRVFTHGAYLSEWDGFPCSFDPVTIGDRVWLPNATVMPGVSIGSDVVVAAGSVVASDLRSGVFAAGSPAVVRRDGWAPPTDTQRVRILTEVCAEAGVVAAVTPTEIRLGDATFDVAARTVTGRVSEASEALREQLRRHGVRFRFEPHDGAYRLWQP